MVRRRSARRSGPGVVNTVARTALIAGTSTAVSGAVAGKAQAKQQAQIANQAAMQTQADVQELQQQMAAMQAQEVRAAAAPASESGAGGDLIAQLQQLADLKTARLLSDAEFEAAKGRLLGP